MHHNLLLTLSFSGGERSPVLQEVSVTIFNNSDCMRAYSSPLVPRRNYPEGIINSQLCAGDPNGGKDACQVHRILFQNWESVEIDMFD
jgi:hypothetical protein